MIDIAAVRRSDVAWDDAVRIIRSVYPPIDLFEDIADPADWPLLISAEQKTNPRLMETIGNLDLVPESRRVGGPGASYLMAPFTHVSPDWPSRFGDGRFGVLYAADRFEVALVETVHHHGLFMARTAEPPGWSAQFREIRMSVRAALHDLRGDGAFAAALDPADYSEGRRIGAALKAAGSDGIVYPSVRHAGGDCVRLILPGSGRRAEAGSPSRLSLERHARGHVPRTRQRRGVPYRRGLRIAAKPG